MGWRPPPPAGTPPRPGVDVGPPGEDAGVPPDSDGGMGPGPTEDGGPGRDVDGGLDGRETLRELFGFAGIDDRRLSRRWIDDQVGIDGEEADRKTAKIHG